MFLLFLRTLLVYAAVIGGLRFTGKRQLGELSTSEFAVTILVSELASIPIQDTAAPLLGGILPLATLLAVEVLVSCLCRRSSRARRLLCGNPCVVIRDGAFDDAMLCRLRLAPEDILSALRLAGVTRVQDVRRAVVEPNGQLSVIPRAGRQPLTADDLHQAQQEQGVPLVLVSEGRLIRRNARQLGKTDAEILRLCRGRGAASLEQVFLLTLDDCGNAFLQLRSGGDA